MSSALSDALDYVTTTKDITDLETLGKAAISRGRELRMLRGLSVSTGARVRLSGLSPKALNGLVGTVTKKNSRTGAVTVELDTDSTQTLRYAGLRRFFVPVGVENFRVTGVPAGALEIVL